MKKYLLPFVTSFLVSTPLLAQETRTQLQNGVNQYITTNGNGAITGAILNNQLQNFIISLGVLTDSNNWTGVNTFSGNVTLPAGTAITNLGFTPLNPSNNLSDVSNASSARTNLGLGPFTVGLPILGNGSSGFLVGGKNGTTNTFATINGTTIASHCPQFDSNGNLVDSGGVCNASAIIPTGQILGNFSGSTTTAANVVPPDTYRNRIYNGAMRIDQRNAGNSVSASNLTTGSDIIDRWEYIGSQTARFTAGKNLNTVGAPPHFTDYLGLSVASAYTVGVSDYFAVEQNLEGFTVADFAFGTANAQNVAVQFQVYSSLTGTFGGSLCNYAGTRCYPFSYTISSANSWTPESLLIPPDTGGTWVGGTNAGAMVLRFGLGAGSNYSGTAGSWATTSNFVVQSTGSTNVVGTANAKFYVTGVQIEPVQITPFEQRPFSLELHLAQRYFECSYDYGTVPGTSAAYAGASGTIYAYFTSAGDGGQSEKFKVTKRSDPTVTVYSPYNGVTGYGYDYAYGNRAVITSWTNASPGMSGFSWYSSSGQTSSELTIHWCADSEIY